MDWQNHKEGYDMSREYTRTTGMHPLTKGLILILIFGIVAMPFVGISFIMKRGNGFIMRFFGFIMLLVSVAAWVYLVLYSIH